MSSGQVFNGILLARLLNRQHHLPAVALPTDHRVQRATAATELLLPRWATSRLTSRPLFRPWSCRPTSSLNLASTSRRRARLCTFTTFQSLRRRRKRRSGLGSRRGTRRSTKTTIITTIVTKRDLVSSVSKCAEKPSWSAGFVTSVSDSRCCRFVDLVIVEDGFGIEVFLGFLRQMLIWKQWWSVDCIQLLKSNGNKLELYRIVNFAVKCTKRNSCRGMIVVTTKRDLQLLDGTCQKYPSVQNFVLSERGCFSEYSKRPV